MSSDLMERRLVGGPLDGMYRMWHERMPLEAHAECPTSMGFDAARYSPTGEYLYSTHTTPGRLEQCGQCTLCPGHRVEVGETIKFQHGEHPEVTT